MDDISDRIVMRIESLPKQKVTPYKSVENAFQVITDLMLEFVEPCKGSSGWRQRQQSNMQKINNNLN